MEISPRFAEQVAEPDLVAGWLAVRQRRDRTSPAAAASHALDCFSLAGSAANVSQSGSGSPLKATPPTAAQYVVYSSLATISLFIMVVFVLVIRRSPKAEQGGGWNGGKVYS
jgi:hypothetical protein